MTIFTLIHKTEVKCMAAVEDLKKDEIVVGGIKIIIALIIAKLVVAIAGISL